MSVTIRIEKKKWKIIGVYVNGDTEEELDALKNHAEVEKEETATIAGGDFNARTGGDR